MENTKSPKDIKNGTKETSSGSEWYKTPGGIMIMVLFFPILLPWYAWAKSDWSKGVKWAVTAGSVLFLIVGAINNQSQLQSVKDTQKITEKKTEQTTNQVKTTPASQTVETARYEFINSKDEVLNSGAIRNKMDLYYYLGSFDLGKLKTLCSNKRTENKSKNFYYLVLFDAKENAVFPNNPFTAFYGTDEVPQKHIKAYCEYGGGNNYSKVNLYDNNAWQSQVKSESF